MSDGLYIKFELKTSPVILMTIETYTPICKALIRCVLIQAFKIQIIKREV